MSQPSDIDGPSPTSATPAHESAPAAGINSEPPTSDEVAPTGEPDTELAAAIELARAAALEVGGDQVGEHLGLDSDEPLLVTHRFASSLAGYAGWHWAVTVVRAPDSSVVTVDEVVLLPGDQALLAPAWLPWAQRVRPGDLGAGDLLPADPDDPRLVPGFLTDGDDEADQVAQEIGFGRPRVLSPFGRDEAVERWLTGDAGPDTPIARQAPAHCGTCGFLVRIAGALHGAFGVCANQFSSADGRAVSVEFGCGAHSEAPALPQPGNGPISAVYDDDELVPL